MSEKQHKTKKKAKYYQNIMVRNSSASDSHGFVRSQNCWSMIFDVMRMITNPLARHLLIALQVVRTSFGFRLREFMGSSLPPRGGGVALTGYTIFTQFFIAVNSHWSSLSSLYKEINSWTKPFWKENRTFTSQSSSFFKFLSETFNYNFFLEC